MNNITYLPCFNNIAPEDKQKIINFWKTEGLANRERFNFEKRLSEVGLIAKNKNGDILGICSFYLAYDEYLDNQFYFLRAAVSKDSRKEGVAAHLVERITYFLEQAYLKDRTIPGIGAVIVYENPDPQKFFKNAVVEALTFYFYAFDKKNCPRRVHYFKDAKILD